MNRKAKQCLLLVVPEQQTNEYPRKSSAQAQIDMKSYVVCPSIVSEMKSAIYKMLKRNSVKIIAEHKQEWQSVQHALECGQVRIVELIIADNGRHIFVQACNINLVSRIFCKPVSISKVVFNTSNIHYKLDEDSVGIIEQLLINKADHGYRNPRGGTLLHLAVLGSNLTLVRTLVKIGATVEAKRKDGLTPLQLAIKKQNVKIISLLLKSGVSINAISENNMTYLLMAVERKSVEVVKLLLENGASAKIGNSHGLMPIHLAARNGLTAIVKELLTHGAVVNDGESVSDTIGSASLWLAVENGSFEVVKLLLDHGAEVNTQHSGLTVLHLAAKKGYLRTVETILKYRPDPSIASNQKALCQVVLKNKTNSNTVSKLMLEQGFSVNAEDITNHKFLCNAVRRNHLGVVTQLLNCGATVMARCRDRDSYGDTHVVSLLHLAVSHTDLAMTELLLKYGADINAVDSRNSTPIEVAIEAWKTDIVQLFLENNSDISRYPEYLCIATECSNFEIVEAFLLKGADPNGAKYKSMSALAVASLRGVINMVELLLKHGAFVEARNSENETALHFACRKGFTDIAKALVCHNADIEAKCSLGKTPILKAMEEGCVEVVQLLLRFDAFIDFSHPTVKSTFLCVAKSGHHKVLEAVLKFCFTDAKIARLTEVRKYLEEASTSGYLYTNMTSKKSGIFSCYFKFFNNLIKVSTANLCDVEKEHLHLFLQKHGRAELRLNCEAEIESMKAQYFDDSKITFYDVLTAEEGQLARFMRLKSVRDAFYAKTFLLMYPEYCSVLECHFQKGLYRKELLEHSIKAAKKSSELFAQIPYEVMEKIFSYVSNKDIGWLVDALMRLKIVEQNYPSDFYL